MRKNTLYPAGDTVYRTSRFRHAGLAGAALLALTIGAAQPVSADVPAETEGTESSYRNVYKTLTYQSVSAFDDFMFGVLFGGGVAAGGVLAAVSITTEPVLYYLHESVWSSIAADSGATETELIPTKTATYTLANMGRVFATGWALTGNPAIGVGFVAFNAVGDAVAYAANDLAWAYFAPLPDPAGQSGADPLPGIEEQPRAPVEPPLSQPRRLVSTSGR